MPPVLATARRVALVEATCFDGPEAFSQGGAEDRGCPVDLGHVAATPMGMRVTARAELVAVEGRKLRFKLECQDEKERRRAPPDRGRGNRRVGWIFAIVTWW
jgi:fluoroacetyl-CoA thioesterase